MIATAFETRYSVIRLLITLSLLLAGCDDSCKNYAWVLPTSNRIAGVSCDSKTHTIRIEKLSDNTHVLVNCECRAKAEATR